LAKTSINHLFPPQEINNLPSWRFALHFKAPTFFRGRKTKEASERLRAAEWKIVHFPFGLDDLPFDEGTGTVVVRVEVSQEDRGRENALRDYESDFWKIYGNMLPSGFGDLFYEAIDWREQA